MLDWPNCQWGRPHALIQRKHFASFVFGFGKGMNLTPCILSGYLVSLLHFPQEQVLTIILVKYIRISLQRWFHAIVFRFIVMMFVGVNGGRWLLKSDWLRFDDNRITRDDVEAWISDPTKFQTTLCSVLCRGIETSIINCENNPFS